MKTAPVNINFTQMAVAFRKHVLFKALMAGSSVVYIQNGQLIEENPKDFSKRILKADLSTQE